MKTLFVFLHGIGDTVMLSGPLREYKNENAEEEIDIVVLNKGAKEILDNNPNLKNIFVSSLEKNPRFWNPILFWFVDYWKIKKSVKNFKRNYNKIKIIYIQKMPEIFYRIFGYGAKNKVEKIGMELKLKDMLNLKPEIFSSKENKAKAEKIIKRLKNYIVVHPFSRDPKKNLNQEELSQIKNNSNNEIVLIGTEKEKNIFPNEKGIYGENLNTVYEIIKKSKGFIGTDSAIAHIAGTIDIPIKVISNRGKIKGITHTGDPRWYLPYGKKVEYESK